MAKKRKASFGDLVYAEMRLDDAHKKVKVAELNVAKAEVVMKRELGRVEGILNERDRVLNECSQVRQMLDVTLNVLGHEYDKLDKKLVETWDSVEKTFRTRGGRRKIRYKHYNALEDQRKALQSRIDNMTSMRDALLQKEVQLNSDFSDAIYQLAKTSYECAEIELNLAKMELETCEADYQRLNK